MSVESVDDAGETRGDEEDGDDAKDEWTGAGAADDEDGATKRRR